MNFTFSFLQDTITEGENIEDDPEDLSWYSAQEIKNIDTIEMEMDNLKKESLDLNEIKLTYFQPNQIINNILKQNLDENLREAHTSHSDLIPSIYEGGYKIWECTFDLLNYMSNDLYDFKGKKVLDLGCGSGLLGILAKLKGAELVHFQDYNHVVLSAFTIPNIKINNIASNDYNCFSGDWESFRELISKKNLNYDIILTSETIYNPSNYKKLYKLFETLLKPLGKVILAAKSYYFGVGGGIQQFEDLIRIKKFFKSKVVWKTDEGVERMILELTKD